MKKETKMLNHEEIRDVITKIGTGEIVYNISKDMPGEITASPNRFTNFYFNNFNLAAIGVNSKNIKSVKLLRKFYTDQDIVKKNTGYIDLQEVPLPIYNNIFVEFEESIKVDDQTMPGKTIDIFAAQFNYFPIELPSRYGLNINKGFQINATIFGVQKSVMVDNYLALSGNFSFSPDNYYFINSGWTAVSMVCKNILEVIEKHKNIVFDVPEIKKSLN